MLITGTPQFYDGPQGVQRSAPLAQRLATSFPKDSRFDNPRAVQLRLQPFDFERLLVVGRRVRDLYPSEARARIEARADDAYLEALARGICGELGGKVGVAPRLYLKYLVDVIDKIHEHADYDPREHEELRLDPAGLTDEEAAAAGVVRSVDDIKLDVSSDGGLE